MRVHRVRQVLHLRRASASTRPHAVRTRHRLPLVPLPRERQPLPRRRRRVVGGVRDPLPQPAGRPALRRLRGPPAHLPRLRQHAPARSTIPRAGAASTRPEQFLDYLQRAPAEALQEDRGAVRAAAGARPGRGGAAGLTVRVLVVGGTRFLGQHLAWRLLAGGHAVTLFNRGTARPVRRPRGAAARRPHDAGLPRRARRPRVRRARWTSPPSTARDARRRVDALDGRVGHYVFISTGQVYLVRDGAPPRPAPRGGLRRPAHGGAPAGHRDRGDWEYGVGKRACEDVLAEAWRARRFPATRLRIPIVNGERDHTRRLEGYVWRMLDGGPVLLPDGGARARAPRVRGAVVRAIAALLGRRADVRPGLQPLPGRDARRWSSWSTLLAELARGARPAACPFPRRRSRAPVSIPWPVSPVQHALDVVPRPAARGASSASSTRRARIPRQGTGQPDRHWTGRAARGLRAAAPGDRVCRKLSGIPMSDGSPR